MCARILVLAVALAALGVPHRASAERNYRVYDTFSDPYDVRFLQNHPPEIHPPTYRWRWLNGEGNTLVTEGVAKNVGGTTREAWMFYVERPDAIVAVDYVSGSASPHGGLLFRHVGPNAYFMLDADGPTLYRNDNGYSQYLGSGGHPVRAGERHRLEVRLEGPIIDVYMDSAFQFRVSDWTYADGMDHGFYFDAPTDPTAVFDNFEISDLSPAPPPCTFAISPLGRTIPADPYSGRISVATEPGCEWGAWSDADFINVVDLSGTGPGSVRYSVENSTRSEPRSGTFTVAGSLITITQMGLAPQPSPSPAAPPSAAASAPPPPLLGLAARLEPGGIVWSANVPYDGHVSQCWGNCGAGCSNKPNPCGGPAYWSNEWLGVPQYVSDSYAISTCVGATIITDTYRGYAVTGRWTYHGRSSDGCRLHDNICRGLGGGLTGFLGCFLGAVLPGSAYCAGARDENWSYTYVLDGRSVLPIATEVMAVPCSGEL